MNAKQELLRLINPNEIKCALIYEGEQYNYETLQYDVSEKKILKVNHTEEELNSFLNSLDFNYDNGYGGQELFGTVWMNDGTWLERGEYDGSEWWEHKICPVINDELLN